MLGRAFNHNISDVASNFWAYRSSDPGASQSERCNYAAGGSGVCAVSVPSGVPLEALAYLCFPDPEMANYEMLKQVSRS